MDSLIAQKFKYVFEPQLIAEIERVASIVNIDADRLMMEIGQTIKSVPLILSGSIKIISEDVKGNELLLYYLEAGDTCAMTMQCCSGKKRSKIRAVSEEASSIAMIPANKMQEWMIKYESWRVFILENFDTRLTEMLEAIDNLAFHNMEERLYSYLRNKAMVTHSPSIHITHREIANDLNSSRVVISRLIKKLELDKKLVVSRNQIQVSEFMQ